MDGKVHFSVDPNDPYNASITDLPLAPRDGAGRVSFSSDFRILQPVELSNGNRKIFFDVVNRGNPLALKRINSGSDTDDPTAPLDPGNGYLMRRGYSMIWCGWQFDIPHIAGLFGIDTFSINPGAKTELLRRTSAAVSPKLHAVLHVGTLISRRQLPTLDQHLRGQKSDSGGDYWIYDVPNVLPRVTICRDILLVTRPQAILDTMASRRFVVGETVILETAPQHVAGDPVGPGTKESVAMTTDRAQTVEIDATLTSDGILVLADLFHDGWVATSNGRPIPILRTNGLCRGVALGAGEHRLRFEFQPASFHRGLWISATTLLGLLLGCGITIVRRRR